VARVQQMLTPLHFHANVTPAFLNPITDKHLSHAFVMVNSPNILQAALVKTSRKRAWEHHSLICALGTVNDICRQVWREVGLQKARCAMLHSISRKACPRRLGSSPAFAASYPQCNYSTGTSCRRTARKLRHFRTCLCYSGSPRAFQGLRI